VVLGVAVTGLVVSVVLAQHLNAVADKADTATQGLLGNAKIQSLLTSVGNLFGGGK
jgi:hypothetical protein